MSAETRVRKQWLLDLLGPEDLAALRDPLTAEQVAVLDAFTAEHLPAHATVMDASDAELPALVERLVAEANR